MKSGTAPYFYFRFGLGASCASLIAVFGRPLQVMVRPMLRDQSPVCNVGVLWPNGWMDQDAAWYEGGPDDIVLDEDPALSTDMGIAALIFRAMPIAVKRSPISATAERCYIYACYY